MNTKNFRKLIKRLEGLPQEVKNREVNMLSVREPTPDTSSDFVGLISLAGKEIPEMIKLYSPETEYNCSRWVLVLDDYLECDFAKWANRHPKVWGNHAGYGIYTLSCAFGKSGTLINEDIILHMRKAYNKWVKLEKGKTE
jgi:hypothetical protein